MGSGRDRSEKITRPTSRPPIPFEATLTFSHPDHAATVSTRIFWVQCIDGPIEMSFTNHRDDVEPDKRGRAHLNGRWGQDGPMTIVFTSSSQTMLDGYKNWIDETIEIRFRDSVWSDTFPVRGGLVSVEYPRKTGGKSTVVKASAELRRITDEAATQARALDSPPPSR